MGPKPAPATTASLPARRADSDDAHEREESAVSGFLETLAATALSAGAALAGVWISNRNIRHGQHELIREEASRTQREMIVNLLIVCREWAGMQYLMVPIMSTMSTDDMTSFVDTESGKRLRVLKGEVQVSLTRAKLFLSDDTLRSSVTALDDFFKGFADRVNGPILADRGNLDPVVIGLREVRAFETALDRLESDAIVRLRSPINLRDGSV